MSERSNARRANARNASTSKPAANNSRTFENGRSKVVAERTANGQWRVTWLSSMGREVSKPFASDEQLDQWLATVGARAGYREVQPDQPAAKLPPMSDAQFMYLAAEISKWMSRVFEKFDGPHDPNWRLAFEFRFGISVEIWDAAQRSRGLAGILFEPPCRPEVLESIAAPGDDSEHEEPAPHKP